MVFEPRLASFLPFSSSARWKLHSRLVQPRTQDSLSPHCLVGRVSSWEEQDVRISHSAPSYLLLRLSSGQVGLRGRGLLLLSHSWHRDSTCMQCLWELPCLSSWGSSSTLGERNKLRRPEATVPFPSTPPSILVSKLGCRSIVHHCPRPQTHGSEHYKTEFCVSFRNN